MNDDIPPDELLIAELQILWQRVVDIRWQLDVEAISNGDASTLSPATSRIDVSWLTYGACHRLARRWREEISKYEREANFTRRQKVDQIHMRNGRLGDR